MAASGLRRAVSRTMKRQNQAAQPYAPMNAEPASGPSGASAVASEPGTHRPWANTDSCISCV